MDETITPDDPGDGNSIEDKKLMQTLVDAGAHYVAATEGALPDGVFVLIDGPHAVSKRCCNILTDIAAVRVDDESLLPLTYGDALFRTTHNRVPLYIADGHEELPYIDVHDGVDNLRRAVEGEWDFTPPRDQTVPLERVLKEFVDAGAVSVTASRGMLGYHERVELYVALPAETVYDIAGRYEKVTFDAQLCTLASAVE